jgi:hypothetical protein
VTEVGSGSRPTSEAVSVSPITAEPEIIGAAVALNGRPAVTAAVGVDVLIVETLPALVPIAWTVIVLPRSEAVRV